LRLGGNLAERVSSDHISWQGVQEEQANAFLSMIDQGSPNPIQKSRLYFQ